MRKILAKLLLLARTFSDGCTSVPCFVMLCLCPGIGNVTGGSSQGFGNTPHQPVSSMGDSIVDGVRQLAERMLAPAAPRQRHSTAAAAAADRKFGHYKAVTIEASVSLEPVVAATESQQNVQPDPVLQAQPRQSTGQLVILHQYRHATFRTSLALSE